MSKDTQAALLKQLKNPFEIKFVKFRVGATNADKSKGIALAYVDSREVMKRLDDVCGVGGWRSRYVPIDGGFICEIDILIDGEWVTKSNAAGYTNVEPIKGGASDAFKRAASTWGIGRYLYYIPNVWAPLKAQGKSYVLADTPELPDWAKPDAVERWEDIAELEAEVNSGADALEVATSAQDEAIYEQIKDITTTAELKMLLTKLDANQLMSFLPEIEKKKKELANG